MTASLGPSTMENDMVNSKLVALHDWNGCLIDDVKQRYMNSVVPIFTHYKLPVPTLSDYTHNITSDFMRYYYDCGVPNSGDPKADGAALNAIMVASMATAEMPPLFPETREFLDDLRQRNARQLLVSSLVQTEFDRQVNHHGVRAFFDEAHGGTRKKHPLFTELLTKYDVTPDQAIGFTDMMSDVEELNAAGVTAILIPRGHIDPHFEDANGKRYDMYVASDLNHALAIADELRS